MKRGSLLWKDSSGSALWLVAIFMFIIAGILAFVIDLAHVKTVKTELSNAADACALRGARAFLPDELPVGNHTVEMDPDEVRAKTQAQDTITKNKSDNSAFELADLPLGDIDVGIWDYEAQDWLYGGVWQWPPDPADYGKYIGPGVRLPTKRNENVSLGSVDTSLARILGVDTVDVTARSTAALSAYGGPTKGGPTLPFGAWDDQLPPPEQLDGYVHHGTFNVDQEDTLGWTNLNPANTNPSADELKRIMNEGALYDCPYGSTVGIQNGVDASVFMEMTKSKNRFGLKDPDGDMVFQPSTEINPDSDPYNPVSYADTVYLMPLFAGGELSGDKFNQSAVVGGVPVNIVEVKRPYDDDGSKYIDVRFIGDQTFWASGHGGGKFYGILTSEPKLVE